MDKKRNFILLIGGIIFLLLFSIILSTSIGSVKIPFNFTISLLLSRLTFLDIEPVWTSTQESIIWNLRLPRIVLAIIVGSMLSVSGTAFQGVLRNPLADPYILGVSSGAALGAAATILFFSNNSFIGQYTLPVFAFIGAFVSLGIVMLIANVRRQRGSETLILAGVIVQSLTGAVLTFLIAISGEQMQSIIFWMMGSLANHDWIDIWVLIPYFLIGAIYLFSQYRELNVISLGERTAVHLGIEIERKKFFILLTASLLAASAVSIVGIIGFVGLVIPHLIRTITGPDHRILLPVATLAGAVFLLWTDTLARTIIPSREIPIGVLTAFIGAPFFAYLLRRGLKRGI